MSGFSRQSGCQTPKRQLRLYRAGLCLLMLLLSLSFPGMASTNRDSTAQPAMRSVARAQFAVADFDGDVRPDLATIESGTNHAGATDYWVQLRLTTAGRQLIRLVAPAGGLWIEARDVNGDHAVDLVLTTAWFNRPVAILLNDGHGRFSRVQPAAFPEAFSESGMNWGSSPQAGLTPAAVPAQSNVSFHAQRRDFDRVPSARFDFRSDDARLRDVCPCSIRGRAPPALV